MFMLSSHILHSLGRHRCYLSHAFLSHPALTSLRLRVVFFLPAHLHSLNLMYIRLHQLDHVPFPGVQKSVSDQISVFAHPNESNKEQCLNKPPVAATSFHSPTISHGTTDGEGWSGRGEGVRREDLRMYVLALCSPLPALTIPPHRLTVQPANHGHQPCAPPPRRHPRCQQQRRH